MKKTIMIAAMMAAAVSSYAQFKPGTFSIQPKAGTSIIWLSGLGQDPVYETMTMGADKESKGGALLGVEFEYQMMPEFSVAAGLNYSMQGGGWEDANVYVINNGDAYSYKKKNNRLDLGYITVPVTANYYIFDGFAVKAGLQFGFMTNASHKYENDKVKYDIDMMSNMNKFDLSVPIGVSYQFPCPIVLDLRYNIGLTKVNSGTPGSIRNNVLLLTVGYKFAL